MPIYYDGILDSDNHSYLYDYSIVRGIAATIFFTSNISNGTTSHDPSDKRDTTGDVVVVRKTPEILGHNGLVMNKFTLMNSVIEFMASNTSSSNQSVYVMGDFALLES